MALPKKQNIDRKIKRMAGEIKKEMNKKPISIGITGSPGTGKTTLAKKLAELLSVDYINPSLLKKTFVVGWDKKRKAYVVDVVKLAELLNKEIGKRKAKGLSCIVESHLLAEVRGDVDFLIILRLSPLKLLRRLRKRYGIEKALENALAEAQDYFPIISSIHYKNKKICELETTNKTKKEVLFLALKAVKLFLLDKKKNKEQKPCSSPDYSKELLQLALKYQKHL